MAETTDWRGTPIVIGARVVAHGLGKNPMRSIGTVRGVSKMVTVEVHQRSHGWRTSKYHIVGPDSVTVLTRDLLDE